MKYDLSDRICYGILRSTGDGYIFTNEFILSTLFNYLQWCQFKIFNQGL